MIVGPEHQYCIFFNALTGELVEAGKEMEGYDTFYLENFNTIWFLLGEL